MKLGFYYHVAIKKNGINTIRIPSYLGVFIDELAKNVDELVLFMHEANDHEEIELDSLLKESNISWVNLGYKLPAWNRVISHNRLFSFISNDLNRIDKILIRCPSPLAPFFYKVVPRKKIVFLVVGDYGQSSTNFVIRSYRDLIITYFLKFLDWKLSKEISKTSTLVNSKLLFNKYKKSSKKIYEIRTTTLTQQDFIAIEPKQIRNKRNLVIIYTGRIDPTKGLFELIESIQQLNSESINCILHIVGWELNPGQLVENELKSYSYELGLEDKVKFFGKQSVGEELNFFYRNADIYCIPSYNEGFPRTIWEAMANGLPVIATKVGGIPDILVNVKNALLIEPKSSLQITESIKLLFNDSVLYNNLRIEGQKIAKLNTLEIQTKKLIEIVDNI